MESVDFRYVMFPVPPMLTIPNQLEAAYVGQDVALECHTEAYPTSINYWTTERGDMIISGSGIMYTLCTAVDISRPLASDITYSRPIVKVLVIK